MTLVNPRDVTRSKRERFPTVFSPGCETNFQLQEKFGDSGLSDCPAIADELESQRFHSFTYRDAQKDGAGRVPVLRPWTCDAGRREPDIRRSPGDREHRAHSVRHLPRHLSVHRTMLSQKGSIHPEHRLLDASVICDHSPDHHDRGSGNADQLGHNQATGERFCNGDGQPQIGQESYDGLGRSACFDRVIHWNRACRHSGRRAWSGSRAILLEVLDEEVDSRPDSEGEGDAHDHPREP